MHRPGIEPGPTAWQAAILPLNQRCLMGALRSRVCARLTNQEMREKEKNYLQSVGFEPTLPEGN